MATIQSQTQPPTTTYSGSCHCGFVRFEIDTHLDHVRVCNCSICHRRGALIHRIPEANLRLFTPLQSLTLYTWGTRTAKDYFCPTCGILPFRRPSAPSLVEQKAGMHHFTGWAINARCLEVDLTQVPRKQINGKAISYP